MTKGNRDRVYAKWHVLHLLWQALAPLCRPKGRAEAFREACERKNEYVLSHLRNAIDVAYVDAIRLYKRNRDKEEHELDVSTYFKRRKLDDDFEKFWRRRDNPPGISSTGRGESSLALSRNPLDRKMALSARIGG